MSKHFSTKLKQNYANKSVLAARKCVMLTFIILFNIKYINAIAVII